MRVVVQRARRAEVRVEGEVVGSLSRPGLLLLVGITHSDTRAQADYLAEKVWQLRILDSGLVSDTVRKADGWSKGDLSCADTGAPLLVISQFTLYADTRKGRRPSWSEAAPAELAAPLFDYFVARLRDLGAEVSTGSFGNMMEVDFVNHGPVTVILERNS